MHGCGAGTNKLYFDLGLPTNVGWLFSKMNIPLMDNIQYVLGM